MVELEILSEEFGVGSLSNSGCAKQEEELLGGGAEAVVFGKESQHKLTTKVM